MGDEFNSPDYENTDKVSSEGIVVICFAGLGLLFDAICLYAYYHFAKKDAEAEYQAMQAQLTESQKTGADAAKIEKPAINMLSALLHVSADLFRSTSTFILGILMVSGALDQKGQDQGDAILALTIGVLSTSPQYMPSTSGGVPSVIGLPHLQAFRWMRRKKVLVIFCLAREGLCSLWSGSSSVDHQAC